MLKFDGHETPSNMDLNDARHLALFEWHQMVLMPRACGSAANWNKDKREHHTLSKGAPASSGKPYIMAETEAYAVLVCKGNAIRWKRQFEIAEDPMYQGRIQRLLGPQKTKKEEVEAELKVPEVAAAAGEEDNSTENEDGEEGDKVEAGAVDEVSGFFTCHFGAVCLPTCQFSHP